jgi:PhnB protein
VGDRNPIGDALRPIVVHHDRAQSALKSSQPHNPKPPMTTAISYLIVHDATAAIDFYRNAFGATEFVRLATPDGKIMHAEIRIGDAQIMVADEFPEMGYRSPQTIGGSPISILLYVADVDSLWAAATQAGATIVQPLADQFDGDRRGTLSDPFGHTWLVATQKEVVSPEELQRRFAAMMQSMA